MNNRLINWFKYASPQSFYPLAGRMIPWFWGLAAVFGIAGLGLAFNTRLSGMMAPHPGMGENSTFRTGVRPWN